MVENEQFEVDETDKKIINLLLKDSKISYRKLAHEVGIALGTLSSRIKKLEENKIIKSYTAHVDYEKLGYNIEVLIFVKISKGNFQNMCGKLSKNPHVFLVFDMTGEYDAIILARFHNKRQLNSFIKEFQQQEHITATRTQLVLGLVREKEVY